MALHLSSRELRNLQDLLRVLLSPLDHESSDHWRSSVNRRMKSLLGADMASFLLPVSGHADLHSEEFPLEARKQYTRSIPRIRGMPTMWERQVQLGVFNRALVYEGHLHQYHRSEYYNDYILPLRAFDSLGVSVQLGVEAQPDCMAGLLFHHDRPTRSFGQRGLNLLRIVQPAFVSAVHTWHAHIERRSSFARLLDRGFDTAYLFSAAGQVLHMTPSLSRLLREEVASDRVSDAARSLALTLYNMRSSLWTISGSAPMLTVRTDRDIYRLAACFVGAPVCDVDAVIVTVKPGAEITAPKEEIQARFGLTRRQVDVAMLLGRGKSNTEIARLLFISPHTARRHTEQILRKLGAHSRAEVGSILLGYPNGK